MAEQAQMTEEELNKKITIIYEDIKNEKINLQNDVSNDVVSKKNAIIEFIKKKLEVLNKDGHKKIIMRFIANNDDNCSKNIHVDKLIETQNNFDNLYYKDKDGQVITDVNAAAAEYVKNTIIPNLAYAIYELIDCDISKIKNNINETINAPNNTNNIIEPKNTINAAENKNKNNIPALKNNQPKLSKYIYNNLPNLPKLPNLPNLFPKK